MFKDIGEAYAVLSDAKKRKRYDVGDDLQDMEGGMPDVDINQIFSMFFSGGVPGGMGGGGGGRRGRGGGMPQDFYF